MAHVTALPATGASRRQFLLGGGAAVAGAALLGSDALRLRSGLELLASDSGPQVPVAHVEGSEGARSLADALAGGSRRAVPAHRVRAGDLDGKALAVTVAGLASPRLASRESAHRAVLVDALVPSPAHADEVVPFYAFTFRRDPAVAVSNPATMRIAAGRGLRFGVRVQAHAAEVEAAAASTVLTSSPQRGLPVLRPGVYLLGLTAGMWGSTVALPALDDPAWATLPSAVLVVEADPA